MNLSGRHILLGVCGGIAAYKACELLRRLRDAGGSVRVVMTESATRFVSPLTFQALSGEPVRVALFDEAAEAGMSHIELARWADALVIAPATADTLARLAHGMADDLLTTLALATEAPLLVAPAMNRVMWSHPAVRENVERLQARGVQMIGPDEGAQACGETGAGRMSDPAMVLERVSACLSPPAGALAGIHVLITAGGTREPIDPVRYLANRSSGRMGYALARAAVEAGARVTLISGPTRLSTPPGVVRVDVETAEQMAAAVETALPADVFIGAAAVSDFRVAQPAGGKIKKGGAPLTLSLVENPDILARVASGTPRPFTVGFAAETERLEEHARSKLERKGLDMLCANDVGDNKAFDQADNELLVLWPGGMQPLPRADKLSLARQVVALIGRRMRDCD
ncbi:MAG: bifunctional phosphopantothenoylcysteine decarboxylase/phosphopantothenate--cysteine ligase CoaBC [Halothiobacillaceae bacterium]